jgi:hypothetical protein
MNKLNIPVYKYDFYSYIPILTNSIIVHYTHSDLTTLSYIRFINRKTFSGIYITKFKKINYYE